MFYSTYSDQDEPSQQAMITAAYAPIAHEVKGTLVPVGAAWDLARKDTTGLLFTGLRYAEARALQWVDFADAIIRLPHEGRR